MTTTCPHCGEEEQGQHPFCLACGGALDAEPATAPAPPGPSGPADPDPREIPDDLLDDMFATGQPRTEGQAPASQAPHADPAAQPATAAGPSTAPTPPSTAPATPTTGAGTDPDLDRWLGGIKVFAGLEVLFGALVIATAWIPKLFLGEPVHPIQLGVFTGVGGAIALAGFGMLAGARLAYKTNRWLVGAVLVAGLFAMAGMVIEGFQGGWTEVIVPLVLAGIGNGILALGWFYLHDHDVMDHFGIEHDGPPADEQQA